MDPETNLECRRLPKGERRVRFADTMGMELVSIFLFDLISNYYFANTISHKQQYRQQQLLLQQQQHKQQQHQQQQQQQQQHHQYQQQPQHHHQHYQYRHNNNNNNPQPTLKQQQAHLTLPPQQPPQQPPKPQEPEPQHQQPQKQQNQQLPHSYICEFTQPISLISFKERVKLNKVHLETCTINSRAGNVSISCAIRVHNLSYDKSVIVRYTTDEWHTYTDSLASYKPGSCDGWSDKFTSTFSIANQVKESQLDQRIIFAIRYSYDGGKVYWDNNGGLNYVVKKF